MFSPVVEAFWFGSGLPESGDVPQLGVIVDETRPEDRAATLFEATDGRGMVRLSPGQASRLGVAHGQALTRETLGCRLDEAGATVVCDDRVFYLPGEREAAARVDEMPVGLRVLSERDAEAFERFTASAPADEMAVAQVGLDDWLTCGLFDGDRLVAIGSMFPWRDSLLVDLGVITLPDQRGRGRGAQVVQAMVSLATERGREPQYRCHVNNTASSRLATRSGFASFGTWSDVVMPSR